MTTPWERALALAFDLHLEARLDLAERMGIPDSTLLRWFQGTARPHPRIQAQMIKILGTERP